MTVIQSQRLLLPVRCDRDPESITLDKRSNQQVPQRKPRSLIQRAMTADRWTSPVVARREEQTSTMLTPCLKG